MWAGRGEYTIAQLALGNPEFPDRRSDQRMLTKFGLQAADQPRRRHGANERYSSSTQFRYRGLSDRRNQPRYRRGTAQTACRFFFLPEKCRIASHECVCSGRREPFPLGYREFESRPGWTEW